VQYIAQQNYAASQLEFGAFSRALSLVALRSSPIESCREFRSAAAAVPPGSMPRPVAFCAMRASHDPPGSILCR
jgi:hypothetical protein